jgi:hypothetical protein
MRGGTHGQFAAQLRGIRFALGARVPRVTTPPVWSSAELTERSRLHSLRIDELVAGDRLIIRTDQEVYDITVIAPARRQIIIEGGTPFPKPVGVRLDGCSSNGRFLELGAIRLGCALEIHTAHGLIVTGPVRSIGFRH